MRRRSLAAIVAMGLVIALALGGIGAIVTVVVLGVTRGRSSEVAADASPAPGFVPAPLPPREAREIVDGMRRGSCRRNDVERTKTRYLAAMRERGAASVLRGDVAIIHLLVTTPGAVWTPEASAAVRLTAEISRAYLLEQARRWSVTDLAIHPILWPVTTAAIDPIRVEGNRKPSPEEADRFRKATRLAIEASLGRRMQAVVEDVVGHGYARVAFVVSFPAGPRGIRDFAAPTGSRGDAAELAYVLEPDWNPTSRSFLVTHELLHLFGADDLYEIRGIPRDEANDVMNAECDGLGQATIGETTAWAIGWTAARPTRTFSFDGP